MVAVQLTKLTNALTDRGELLSWRPGMYHDRWRQLFVTRGVWTGLQSGWASLPGEKPGKTMARQKALHSLMGNWLEGLPLELGDQLKPLDPWDQSVWEFRTDWPRPGARLFGFLADRNVFVAVGLYDRNYLGPGGSREWAVARDLALREWERLYPDQTALACPMSMRDPVGLRGYWNDKAV